MLQVHIAVGLLLAVAAPLALAFHLKQTSSPAGGSIKPVVLLLFVPVVLAQLAIVGGVQGREDADAGPIARLSVWLWGADGGDGGSIAEASLAAMVLVAAAALLSNRIRARDPSVPVRWTGALATGVVFAALTTGLFGFLQRGDFRFDAYAGHSLLGLLAIVASAAHFKAPRRVLGPKLGPVVFGATVAVVVGLWAPSYRAEHRHGFDPDLIPERWAVRTLDHARGDDGPAPAEASLAGSASCGAAGCHEALTHQWSGSAHRYAADNDLYRAVTKQLVTERGSAEVRFCAACHDPVRALAGTVETAYADGDPPPGDGVSCVVCHAVFDHPGDVENGNAAYRAPIPYPGASEEARARQTKLDPRFHRQNFAARVTTSRRLCGSCHRVHLGPSMGAAVEAVVQNPFDAADAPECEACHMPTTTPLGLGSTRLYDHHLAGGNLDLAAYATDEAPDADALAEVWSRADELLSGDGAGVLELEIGGRRDGGALLLTVTSSNRRVGHAFPLGPFDLREVWQSVVARDAGGAIVWERGAVDATGVPDPKAPRLGATELDRAGDPLARHRIWDVGGMRDKRLVEPGEAVVDEHRIEAAGPLQIEVTWHLRRTNVAFTRWVYGPDHPGFPIHDVARGSWQEP